MKIKTLIASSLFLGSFLGCVEQGPDVPKCILLEDLKRAYCIPFNKKDPEYTREMKAGDYDVTPEEEATVLQWILRHKK